MQYSNLTPNLELHLVHTVNALAICPLLCQLPEQLKENILRQLIKTTLISLTLMASLPSIAQASHGETFIAAAIGGAAGAFIGNSISTRDRYDNDYQVRHIYVSRQQPIERVVYVQPSYRESVYYYDEPRYVNYRHHYKRHGHNDRFRDHDDD